jgi:four helix bundle protein
VSSIGANDKEADASESRKDFIAKYSIVKKETSETLYWIQLLCDINNNNRVTKEKNYLVEEGIEIYKIVTSIIIKTRNKPS